MNPSLRKSSLIPLLAIFCLLAVAVFAAAPVLAGTPALPPGAQSPAPAPPAVVPAPEWPGSGAGYGYGSGSGEGEGGSYLGIDVREVTTESMQQLKLKEERGAEITMVDQDAPAGKAGLKEHDVILEFDGQKVEGVEQLRRMIHEIPPGRAVKITYSRDGSLNSVQVQLANRETVAKAWTIHAPEIVMPKVEVQVPRIEVPAFQIYTMSPPRAGLLVSNLTPQLGEYFGCKKGEGVLVQSVEKGSAAEAAGFKAGDVIVKAGDQRITDLSDWRSALRGHREGKIAVGILRDKKEQTLTLSLPARRESGDAYRIEIPDLDLEMQALELNLDKMQPALAGLQAETMARLQAELAAHQADLDSSMAEAQKGLQKAMKARQKAMEKQQKELERRLQELDKLREMRLEIDEE